MKMFSKQWEPNARAYVQALVSHITCVCWPPQSRTRVFEYVYLFDLALGITCDKFFVVKSTMSIRGYIQNLILTCTHKVGDPSSSQNIALKYEVPKAKQKKSAAKK